MNKLILEELEDEIIETPEEEITEEDMISELTSELSEEEKQSFEVVTICDLLKDCLDKYSFLTSLLNTEDNNISEKIKIILESVNEDVAGIIGKLQQSLKEVSDDNTVDTIDKGEEEILDTTEDSEEEE